MPSPYSNPYSNSNSNGNSNAPHDVPGNPINRPPAPDLTAAGHNSMAQAVPLSAPDPASSGGWLSWPLAKEYLEQDVGLSSVEQRAASAWSTFYIGFDPTGLPTHEQKYYFIALSNSVYASVFVSDSATAPTNQYHYRMTFSPGILGGDKVVLGNTSVSTGTSSSSSSGGSSPPSPNVDPGPDTGQATAEATVTPDPEEDGLFGDLNEVDDDNNGNVQDEPESDTQQTQTPYREDFTPIDPTTQTLSPGNSGTVFEGIVQSDNLRFDINSSNMFSGIVEGEAVNDSLVVDSSSPVEKEGISANRPSILVVSDYDLYGHEASNNVLASSLNYSKAQHEILYKFYNEQLFPEIELLTELEEIYETKKNRLLKSIQFIKEIDEFKIEFINTITDYDSYGLQILGYVPGLNGTTAIRQAFYDLSAYIEQGGYFLANSLKGVYETPGGLSSDEARILDTDFNAGYVFQKKSNWFECTTTVLSPLFGSLYGESERYRNRWGDYIIYSNQSGWSSQRQNSSATFRSYKLYEDIAGDWNLFKDYLSDAFSDSKSAMASHIAQGIYVNLLKSYVVNTNGLQDAEDLGEEYFNEETFLIDILGDAIDGREGAPKPLSDLDNTKKLAQILKYNSAENNVYPFEKPNVNFSGDSSNSVSGIEKWFDQNIGNIIEGRETDFRGLDEFSKLFADIVSKTENKLNAVVLKGHGQIIINEIVRALQKVYDGSLDTETHPQPGMGQPTNKCMFMFDDVPPRPTFTPITTPEETSNENLLSNQESTLVKDSLAAQEIQRDIVSVAVQEGQQEAAETIAFADQAQQDIAYYVQDRMDLGGYMGGEPQEGEDIMNVGADAAFATEMSADAFLDVAEGFSAATFGVMSAATNAIGEHVGGNAFANAYGAGAGGAGLNVTEMPMQPMQAVGGSNMVMSFLGMDLSDQTVVFVGDLNDTSNALATASPGVLFAEQQAGVLKSKEYYFRKLCFIIDMFARIDSYASTEEFWNLSYNSIQGQIEKNPSSPGLGTDHERYRPYTKIIGGKTALYESWDHGIGLYSHGLQIINSVCAEIEKNIAYDIAVACNEYGIVSRTPGEYSNSTAVSILSTIFGEGTSVVYGQSLASGESQNIFLHGHVFPGDASSSQKQAFTHVHFRALMLDLVSKVCKVFKSQFGYSFNNFTNASIPKEEIQLMNGAGTQEVDNDGVTDAYVVISHAVDRIKLEAAIAQLFLPVVDNVDPANGPVRWQISYGDWSESGLELENEDFVDRLVVSKGTEQTLAGTFSLDVVYNPDGDVPLIPGGDYAGYAEKHGVNFGSEGIAYIQNKINQMEASTRAYYSFLLKKDDIIPYNFIDDRELPNSSFSIVPPRGNLAPIIKGCVYHREDTRRLMEYLKAVSKHFTLAQQSMEGLIKDPNGAELFEAATLPGIEANEIIKYSSLRQTFLRSFLASEEAGIPTSGYSPSATYMDIKSDLTREKITSIINNMLMTNSLIGDHLSINSTLFLRPGNTPSTQGQVNQSDSRANLNENSLKFGRIVNVGIPAGYIDYNKPSKPLDILNRLVFLQQDFSSLNGKDNLPFFRCFWPALFINRAELIRALAETEDDTYESLRAKLNYGTIDKDTGRYTLKDYNTISDYIQENILSTNLVMPSDLETNIEICSTPDRNHIIFNHVLDSLLKLYMDLYAGLNVTESSFSVNLQSNVLYVDQTALDNIDQIIEYCKIESPENILDGNMILPFKTFYKNQTLDSESDIAYEKYAKFVSTTQSRLFSADQMTTMALVPNIFDRTFCVWNHMGQVTFETEIPAFGIYGATTKTEFYDISDDGTFDSDGFSGNIAFNDFNAQIIFRSYST